MSYTPRQARMDQLRHTYKPWAIALGLKVVKINKSAIEVRKGSKVLVEYPFGDHGITKLSSFLHGYQEAKEIPNRAIADVIFGEA